ncbi:Gfo/Idh/MocA family protein [Asanoa iriomotensis]|uniref:Dehydrogenase n=1 Tax=Asanoa iriomotensis TaxID=234613 RepID=A0ABQ4CEF0_9ACTN|nr:Gfo/Idh/MocA family oxidoreductase [Asanoa iriomotensis]GIF61142.1 dehydrogenase [Asanoa iriomotensis]
MIGVSVIGAGFWARQMHLPALAQLPGVRITSVVATSPESAQRAAAPYDEAQALTDIAEAAADPDTHVLDIVAPPDVHLPAVEIAAAHGKHAICIKPLARDLDEADRMLEAVDEAGTRLFYAENVPFIPALQEARQLVDAGDIGTVFRVKACEGIGEPHSPWFFDPDRSGGGAILDMAVHSLEFCRFFAKAPITAVYAEAGTFVHHDRTTAEDTAVLTLRFANGVIGQCEDSWSLQGAMDSRFEVFGTEGRILVDNLHRQPLQVVNARAGWSYPMPIAGLVADGHLAMLGHFLDCLRSGAPSLSDGHVGRDVLAVVDAAYRSVASGRREEIKETTR